MAAPNAVVEPTSDEELVGLLRAGDEAAFNELYERYYKRIFLFVGRRIDNRADAEETVQEVFINIFSSIESFRGEAPFVAWAFGLTRRTIANRFKRKRLTTVPMEDEGGENDLAHPATPAVTPNPFEAYECSERAAQLANAVSTELSEEQQALFRMHHLEERPIAEIAQQIGKSEDAVKSNLYRTRKVLLAS